MILRTAGVARRLLGGREGQSVSEFLVATPILAFFILAIVYLGRIGTTYARLELASAQWGIYAGRTQTAGDAPGGVAGTQALFFTGVNGGAMGASVYNYASAQNDAQRGVRDGFGGGADVDMFYDFADDSIWDRTGQADGPDLAATRGAGLWGACDLQALFLFPGFGMEQDATFGLGYQETWKEGVRLQSSFDGGRTASDVSGGDYLDPSFKYYAARYHPGSGYGPGTYTGFTLSDAEFQPLFHDDGSQDGARGIPYGTVFNDVEYYNDAQPNAFMTPLATDSTEVLFSGRWVAAADPWAYSATLAGAGACAGGQCDAFVGDNGLGVFTNSSFWEPLITPLLAFDPACP